MSAGHYDITSMEAGSKYSFLLSQSGLDLTGYTAEMQIRASAASANPLVTLATGGGGITITVTPAVGLVPVSSAIDIEFTGAQTASLGVEQGVYDVKLFPPAGEPWRFIEGAVYCKDAVTR